MLWGTHCMLIFHYSRHAQTRQWQNTSLCACHLYFVSYYTQAQTHTLTHTHIHTHTHTHPHGHTHAHTCCWLLSSRAMIILGTAHAVPLTCTTEDSQHTSYSVIAQYDRAVSVSHTMKVEKISSDWILQTLHQLPYWALLWRLPIMKKNFLA